ncbi:hypothetical protein HPP92_011952 [Vanilla planifolia]|uniref:Uncharacterized protein n=1 Tax=Vanilla planifolia TaxID=51239 RepID=A0A835UZ96_VANPL|nr:hypothetical protein HPP92_012307 [Vanilla planifolia]KAG0483868.1 hypothetical protein HPP92_011952 [Vanilla planifolia]
MAVGAFPGSAGASWLTVRPWVRTPFRSTSSASFSVYCSPRPPLSTSDSAESLSFPSPPSDCSFFPKRGQTLELVCESLAFKGKGVCKVSDSGFVFCAIELSLASVSSAALLAEKEATPRVTKLKTITPHRDLVKAPWLMLLTVGVARLRIYSKRRS